ncbi:hypothetical protein L209DRAFT_753854 [Thermothelomyces heterothallicus CBS 203.75]
MYWLTATMKQGATAVLYGQVLFGGSCSEDETIHQRREGTNGATPPTQSVMRSSCHIPGSVRKRRASELELDVQFELGVPLGLRAFFRVSFFLLCGGTA